MAQELMIVTVIGGDGYGEFMNEIAGDAMSGTYWINHTYLGTRSWPRFALQGNPTTTSVGSS